MQAIQYYECVMGEEAAQTQGPAAGIHKELVHFTFISVSHAPIAVQFSCIILNLAGY